MFLKNTKKVQKANINKVLYLSVFLCITCNVRSFLGEGMKIVRKLFAERSYLQREVWEEGEGKKL